MSEDVYAGQLLYAQQREEEEATQVKYRRGDIPKLVENVITAIPRVRDSWRVKTFLAMNMGCVEEAIAHCILPILTDHEGELHYYKNQFEQEGDTAQFQEHRQRMISQLLQGSEERYPTLFRLAETAGRLKYIGRHYDIREHAQEILMNPKVYAQCVDMVLPYLKK